MSDYLTCSILNLSIKGVSFDFLNLNHVYKKDFHDKKKEVNNI